MNKNIVVVGSSNTDMIVAMDHIPAPGETVLGGDFSTAAGGKGANQAVAAARAGGTVTFVARVGDDLFGRTAVEGFKADGIDTSLIQTDKDAPSGVALIFVGNAGENSIAVASGANGKLSPADIDQAADCIKSAAIVLVQLETPIETVTALLNVADANSIPVVLNPAPAQELDDALLGKVSIITPNESEAEILTGIQVTDESTAIQAASALLARGPGTVVITMGSRGALVKNCDIEEMIPAFKVDAVDTTAAGDTFNGVLAANLAQGVSLQDAVRFANAAAALSVTVHGAQPSAPHRDVIEAFLAASSR